MLESFDRAVLGALVGCCENALLVSSLGLLAIAALTIALTFRKRLPRAVLAGLIAFVLAELINSLVPRLRPNGLSFDSFPSGHATLAAALALQVWKADQHFGILAAWLALAVGISRIVLALHWPSDILTGFALGAAVSAAVNPKWV